MVSIIIPAYNAEKVLGRCLSSIEEQMYKDWECIVIDDGSKNPLEYSVQYSDNVSKIRIIRQDNVGPGAARNRGVEEAKGEYVIFVDADDWVEPDYFATIMTRDLEGVDAVMWGYESEASKAVPHCSTGQSKPCNRRFYKDANGILLAIAQLMVDGKYGFSVTCRFKKDILMRYGIRMKTDIKLHEDAIFTNEYCQHVSSLAVLDYKGYHYVVEETSLSNRKFYPTDEMLRIADYLYQSAEKWILGEHVIGRVLAKQYLDKLMLSVVDMYDKRDTPQKNQSERLDRIAHTTHEVKRLYGKLEEHSVRHRIFRWLPIRIIDILWRNIHS